jgi:hypothetical protein
LPPLWKISERLADGLKLFRRCRRAFRRLLELLGYLHLSGWIVDPQKTFPHRLIQNCDGKKFKSLSQNELLQQLHPGLPEESRDYGLLKSGGIELDSHNAILVVKGYPPHAIDFANTIDGPHCAFGWRSRVPVSNFE